jgi:ferrochelatase
MVLKNTLGKLPRTLGTGSASRLALAQTRSFATPVPPVTQDATGSKGPTAMVFLNMGGPSKTDEVGDFLSRLFVRQHLENPFFLDKMLNLWSNSPTAI